MVNTLTDKQQETMDLIVSYIASHSVPPTLSELQVLLNVSSNQAVLNHLDALEEKGFIERKKTARGIRVIKSADEDAKENDGNVDFLDLLTGLAEKKRQRAKKPRSVEYADPYSADENSGKIIIGRYNNEQY